MPNDKHTTVDQLQMLATRTKQELTTLETEINKKQDKLVFNTAYDKDTNKAATMADVQGAVEGLKGAMHFIGDSETDPTVETTPGTQDGPTFSDEDKLVNPALATYTPQAGDQVTFGSKEYMFNGVKWREYGDETNHVSKVAPNKTDEILTATAAGGMQTTGKKLGGAVLGDEEEAASTMATEAAVSKAIEDQEVVTASTNGVGGAKGLMSPEDKEKLDGFDQATDDEVAQMLIDVFGELPQQSGT